MKNLPILLIAVFLMIQMFTVSTVGQNSMVLSFTGIYNANQVNLSSVNIRNINKSCDTTLYWPDTTLTLNTLGVNDLLHSTDEFRVFQNEPNPAGEKTFVKVYIPEKGNVEICIIDFSGRMVASLNRDMDRGYHTLLFEPGSSQLYVFTAIMNSNRKSIKIAAPGNRLSAVCQLSYNGAEEVPANLKSVNSTRKFGFSLGDMLEFTGYYNSLFTSFQDSPATSKQYTFNFSTGGTPCPGVPTVTYESKVYHTVLIGTQCWFKENLNVGVMIDSLQNQTNNGTIEKYCYSNLQSNCDIYGGLYQWDEAMQYVTTEGVRGICPGGWHIPTDAEWTTLTTYLGGELVAGGKMKETGFTHWASPNTDATNSSGFTALPGGYSYYGGYFGYLTDITTFWSSSQTGASYAWNRGLDCSYGGVYRGDDNGKTYGFSGRCLQD